jgi:CheY-like chemotaxis protein
MKILLVEDSPEVAMITVEYLNELGHETVAVADAELAVGQVSAQPFDVVMTDVSLPGMSGIDLAKALGVTHPRLPVVVASGYGNLNLQNLLGPERANHVLVLTKPYDMSLLEATLEQALTLHKS